jgi:hypothetical protein
MEIGRRVRGVLGTALVWGASWGLVGLAIVSVALRLAPASVHLPRHIMLQNTLAWGVFGAVSGAVFAIALSFAERRAQSLDTLSVERVSAWGAIGGAVLPLAMLPVWAVILPAAVRPGLVLVTLGGVLGAASATASLRLAQRGRESLSSASSGPRLAPPT